jgi:putative membrane protein
MARRADVKGFILAIAAGAIAFLLLLQILPSSMIDLKGEFFPQQVLVAVIVGGVNAVIKPIVKALAFPISLMTMGLAGFVINAGLLLATAFLVQNIADVTFTIGGWPVKGMTADTLLGAVVASALLSIITTVVGLVVHD